MPSTRGGLIVGVGVDDSDSVLILAPRTKEVTTINLRQYHCSLDRAETVKCTFKGGLH